MLFLSCCKCSFNQGFKQGDVKIVPKDRQKKGVKKEIVYAKSIDDYNKL